jgi:glycosyltransferase involved in cell wall biosynthesis
MVIVVGPLPPPVHGASLITAHVKERLAAAQVSLLTCDTSPRFKARGLAYFFSRVGAYIHCCGAIIKHRQGRERTAVYLSLSGGLGLVYDLAVVIAARLKQYDLILHHHTFSYIAAPSPVLKGIVKVAGRRQVHIALCPSMARKLGEIYGGHLRVEVISNLVFMDLPETAAQRTERPLAVIGYLSTVSFAKGIDRYLDLLALLRAKGSRIKGLIAGPCDDGDVEKFVERRIKQIGGIDYVGAAYAEAKTAFLSSIDLLIFPSRLNEAQPLVIFEAQAAGALVAASQVGCIADMVGPVPSLLFASTASTLEPLAEQILAWEKDTPSFRGAAQQVRGAFTSLLERCTKARAQFEMLMSVYR